jgi:15-cis-phytoene synthase
LPPAARAALVEHARHAIARGSKSFAAASRLFDRATRERVWLLYAWCRACDDMADAQDMGGALGDQGATAEAVAQIHSLTGRAMAGEATGNPAFDALTVLRSETAISQTMLDDVVAGFELDADGWRPRSEADMLRYCYHVAGAVGALMAAVMGVAESDADTLDRACDLGLAFQLANIARDIAEDHAAGRCYLPQEWLEQAGIPASALTAPEHRGALVALVARLCELAGHYEASARVGAARLRFRQRWAVLSAAGIYGEIAREVKRRGADAIEQRVHTGKADKVRFVLRALFEAMAGPRHAPSPLWSRRKLAALARKAA